MIDIFRVCSYYLIPESRYSDQCPWVSLEVSDPLQGPNYMAPSAEGLESWAC